jgi:hypothetical protein
VLYDFLTEKVVCNAQNGLLTQKAFFNF